MPATPGSFEYWNRGEPFAHLAKSTTGSEDYWNRGEPFRSIIAVSGGTIVASAGIALGPLVASGSGTFLDNGSASITLGPLAGSGAGTFLDSSSAAATLGPIVAAGSGSFADNASAAVTLGSLSSAATATFSAAASTSAALGPIAAAGSGFSGSVATAAMTLGPVAAAGSGTFLAAASASATLGAIAAAGSAGPISGSAAIVRRRPWHARPPQGWPLDAGANLTQGLVGFWPLNEGAGAPWNVATRVVAASNSMAWSAGPAPRLGALQNPGGTALSVQVPVAAGSPLDITGKAISFGAWVYPTVSNTYQTVISLNAGATDALRQYSVYLNANGTSFLYISMAGGAIIVNNTTTLSVPWAVNAWNHVLVTYDGAHVVAYINGRQAASVAATASIARIASSTLYLGYDAGVANFGLHGSVDAPAVWNRCLTAAEAAAIGGTPDGIWPLLFQPSRTVAAYASGPGSSLGSASITLSAAGLVAAGTFSDPGSAAATLGPIAAAGSGSFATAASGPVTLGAIAAAAAGTFATAAAASATLGPIITAGTAGSGGFGAASIALGATGASGVAATGAFATAAVGWSPVAVVAIGTFATAGSASVTLRAAVPAGLGAGSGTPPSPLGTVDPDVAAIVAAPADPARFLVDADTAALASPHADPARFLADADAATLPTAH